MADIGAIQEALATELAGKHHAREEALGASRRAIRAAANAIRAAHRGDVEAAERLCTESDGALRQGHEACAGHDEVAHAGFLHDAAKELVEARTTVALLTRRPLPTPDELGVRAAAYANGLAETVGELRRHLLDVLRAGELERCEELLDDMDDIYTVLVSLDFPDGVTGGLRRSTDVARAIIERTRGDLTTALVQARLQVAIDAHRRDVLGA
jgi:translin